MPLEENDIVLLTDLATGEQHLARLAAGAAKVKGLGVIDMDKLAALGYGGIYEIGTTRFFLSKPLLHQQVQCLDRKAQVILPKDIPIILYYGDIPNARLVVEGGAGSGFLTCSMGAVIKPPGRVVTYELREDFIAFAKKNVEAMSLTGVCTLKQGDVTRDVEETDADAFVVDIPNPADCVDAAWKALRPGGVFISYVPNTNQVEACVKAMQERGFRDVGTIETLQRSIVVTEGGTRPDFNMLGHTGYITIGYKIDEGSE